MTISSPSASVCDTDALAVDEDAVEAAVVEHADAVVLDEQHGVAARDGRILEAQLGRQAAADAHRVAGHRDGAHAAGVVEDEVAAGLLERVAGGVDQRVAARRCARRARCA